ncbi:MAG: hypothetical protein FWC68_06005, partial [Oscillospiraceae bacterium]|nr:hypothetical protein [Oscillospiraceae bacterium]
MASTIVHLTIAEFLNSHYLHFEGEAKKRFLLGSIIVDSYQIAEERVEGKSSDGKKVSHFIRPGYRSEPEDKLDFTQWLPNVKDFLDKYSGKLEDPFYLGYLSHLLADEKWWGELVTTIA